MEERSSTRPGGSGSGLSLKTLKGKRKQDLRFSRFIGLRRRSFFIPLTIIFFEGDARADAAIAGWPVVGWRKYGRNEY